jgi:zinc transport system substrate-binding protein
MERLSSIKIKLFILTLLLIIYPVTVVVSCTQHTPSTEKIGVAVTILPQAEFVERIGGDKVDVTVMIPPGASPHTYEPTPSQMVSLSNAKLYAKVGTAIDFEIAWMDELIATNPAMLVVDCSQGVTLQEMTVPDEDEPAGGMDPHIWTSPRNAAIMVQNIANGLIQIDPVNQDYYQQNRDAYLQEINKLDTDIRDGLVGVQNRVFMVYHPAFGYFAAEYGLTQLPVETEGKEPTAAGIQHLIEQARKYDIKVVFAEPQFNPQSAEVIANEIGGQVILIDPLAEDYLANMRTVAEKMIAAME